MKEGKYTKALAKIQVGAIFHVREIRGIFFTYIYRALYGDAMLVPIRMVTNMADGNQQTCVTELCYLRVNLSLEELINIDINRMTIQMAKSRQQSHFFSLHGSSLVRHVNSLRASSPGRPDSWAAKGRRACSYVSGK